MSRKTGHEQPSVNAKWSGKSMIPVNAAVFPVLATVTGQVPSIDAASAGLKIVLEHGSAHSSSPVFVGQIIVLVTSLPDNCAPSSLTAVTLFPILQRAGLIFSMGKIDV